MKMPLPSPPPRPDWPPSKAATAPVTAAQALSAQPHNRLMTGGKAPIGNGDNAQSGEPRSEAPIDNGRYGAAAEGCSPIGNGRNGAGPAGCSPIGNGDNGEGSVSVL